MKLLPLVPLLLSAACASASVPCPTAPPAVDRRGEIDAFNQAMIDVTRRMDTAGILAQWEDDGASLLPGTKPIEGKKALAAFLAKVDAELPGAHMRSFEMHCAGIEISGDVASEYCDEHQIVDLGPGKDPFDGRGKMLFVLHRGADGKWHLRREMWNQGQTP